MPADKYSTQLRELVSQQSRIRKEISLAEIELERIRARPLPSTPLRQTVRALAEQEVEQKIRLLQVSLRDLQDLESKIRIRRRKRIGRSGQRRQKRPCPVCGAIRDGIARLRRG